MKNTWKRLLSLMLSIAMVLGMLPALAADTGFSDVDGHWGEKAINTWRDRSVIAGNEGKFRPDDSITRAEVAQIIANLLGLTQRGEGSFDDVSSGAWYEDAVLKCAEAGVMKGDGVGFRPLDPISRQETMTVLTRALALKEAQADLDAFADGAEVADWAESAVKTLLAMDAVHGRDGGLLAPKAGISRAEVVTLLNNMISVYINESGIYPLNKERTPGVVLVTAKEVTLTGETAGVIVIGQGSSGGKISFKNLTAPEATVQAENLALELLGQSQVQELRVPQEEQAVTVKVGPASKVSDITGAKDVNVIHQTAPSGGSGGSSGGTGVAPAPTDTPEPTPGPVEEGFPLFDGESVPMIYVDSDDHKQVVRAVGDLQEDVERVTTKVPVVTNTLEELSGLAIIVGSVEQSDTIKAIRAAGKLDEANELDGKWESYLLKIVDQPVEGVDQAIVIAGSDKRGTVYGIYDLSEQIGVSPWYYWGDITPEVKSSITITERLKMVGEPSVKYRGIFINDEQNLVQWATIKGPDADKGGNLGPETYKSVYELLLRLKANYLWPGMHSETRLGENVYGDPAKAQFNATDYFNMYPENRANADLYGIVVGTSHCEPMMRNGTAEWGEFLQQEGYLQGVDFKTAIGKGKVDAWMYNYNKDHSDKIPRYDYSELVDVTNGGTQREFINKYWNESVEWYKDYEVSYTLGMRGVHDEGFRFANTNNTQTKLQVLQDVVDAQVKMLEDNQVTDEAFPIFIPYKEVLPLYNQGLKLPEDTIIVWADDNFGYNRRFPTEEENSKYAGSGIYYHMSYEGGPTRYQWMNGTPPAQMLSELSKAYESGIQALWVLNVGDIKPSEIGMEFFLDMAWDVDKWNDTNLQDPSSGFLTQLAKEWFPNLDSREVGGILEEYFRLCYDRKPHHTNTFTFNTTNVGDEATQRVADYQDIAQRTQAILDTLQGSEYDLFFELVGYQVLASYYANLKYYYAQRSGVCAAQGRAQAANLYSGLIDWAQERENALTEYFNTGAFGGKWELMMQPANFLRGNPAGKPSIPAEQTVGYFSALELVCEGQTAPGASAELTFSTLLKDTHYVDLFNLGGKPFDYTVTSDKSWVKVSEPRGTIYDEQRLFLEIDWAALPGGDQSAILTVQAGMAGERTLRVTVSRETPAATGYTEANGYVAIEAEHFTDSHKVGEQGFVPIALGHSGGSLAARPMGSDRYEPEQLANAPYVTYPVTFETAGSFKTTLYRIPTLDEAGQRVALQVDDGNIVVFAGGTTTESSGWGNGVQRNLQKVTGTLSVPTAGAHTIKMYMMDPGVCVDRIVIDTGAEPVSHLGPKESYHSVYNTDTAWTPKLLTLETSALEDYMKVVEAKVAELDVAKAARLQGELDAVKAALQGGLSGDETRRNYARLMSAMAEADTDMDALWADAQARADALEAAAEATKDYVIPPYAPEEIAAFKTLRTQLESGYAAAGTEEEKMTFCTQLISAVLGVKRAITITASSQEANHPAEKVMDGKGTAGNSGDDRWAANGAVEDQWVLIDLHEVYDLSKISILWFGDSKRTYQYVVETSLDGVNFTTAVDRSGNTKSQLVEDGMAVTARYVRISTVSKSGGSYSIWEIKLEGSRYTSADDAALTALRQAVAKAESDIATLNGEDYTVDSFDGYQRAIEEAEALLEQEKISDDAVSTATTKLKQAKAELKERKVVAGESFDAVSTRDELTDWTFHVANGAVTLEEEGGNKYLKLDQQIIETASKSPNKVEEAIYSFGSLSGKVYIQADLRTDNGKTMFAALAYPSAGDTGSASKIISGVQLRDGQSDDECPVKTYTTAGSSSTAAVGSATAKRGEWNTLCLVLDTEAGTAQVYWNGRREGNETYPIRNASDVVGAMRFYTDDYNKSGQTKNPLVAYVDNVVVYQEKPAEILGTIELSEPEDRIIGNVGTRSMTLSAAADNGETVSLEVVSSDEAVLTVSLSGKSLTLTPVAEGTAEITLTATAEKCSPVEKTFQVTVKEPLRPVAVTASNANDANNPPESAIDGDLDTRWGSSNTTFPQWIQADLGKAYPLEELAIKWFINGSRAYYYTVSVSLDGTSFTQVVDARDNKTAGLVVDPLPEGTLARYVKIDVTGKSTSSGNASLFEIMPIVGTSTIADDTLKRELTDKLAQADSILEAADADSVYTIDSLSVLRAAAAAAEEELDQGSAEVLRTLSADLTEALDGIKRREEIYSQDFNGVADLAALDGWTVTTGTYGAAELATEDGNGCVKLYQTHAEGVQKTGTADENTAAIYLDLTTLSENGGNGLSGKTYIQAKVRQDTLSTFCAPMLYKNKEADGSFNASAAGVTDVQLRPDQGLQGKKGNTGFTILKPYGLGEWLTVTLILQEDGASYEIFVDGNPYGVYALRNAITGDAVRFIRFYSDDKTADRPNTQAYVDDLVIYREAAQ